LHFLPNKKIKKQHQKQDAQDLSWAVKNGCTSDTALGEKALVAEQNEE